MAGVVCEAWTLRLQECWLTLHLLPQRQDLPLIILQTLLIYIFQPKFLQQNNTEYHISYCTKLIIKGGSSLQSFFSTLSSSEYSLIGVIKITP